MFGVVYALSTKTGGVPVEIVLNDLEGVDLRQIRFEKFQITQLNRVQPYITTGVGC